MFKGDANTDFLFGIERKLKFYVPVNIQIQNIIRVIHTTAGVQYENLSHLVLGSLRQKISNMKNEFMKLILVKCTTINSQVYYLTFTF